MELYADLSPAELDMLEVTFPDTSVNIVNSELKRAGERVVEMKILIEESVLRQALEALEIACGYALECEPDAPFHTGELAITNLRAELDAAEKVEPVGEVVGASSGFVGDCIYGVKWANYVGRIECGTKLYTHPAPAVPEEIALQKYTQLMEGCDEPDPVERLRFFLSLALKGQDWLDVERFIDDLAPAVPERTFSKPFVFQTTSTIHEGWQLVPKDPTEMMLWEICPASADLREWEVNYKAMLAAAPKPEGT